LVKSLSKTKTPTAATSTRDFQYPQKQETITRTQAREIFAKKSARICRSASREIQDSSGVTAFFRRTTFSSHTGKQMSVLEPCNDQRTWLCHQEKSLPCALGGPSICQHCNSQQFQRSLFGGFQVRSSSSKFNPKAWHNTVCLGNASSCGTCSGDAQSPQGSISNKMDSMKACRGHFSARSRTTILLLIDFPTLMAFLPSFSFSSGCLSPFGSAYIVPFQGKQNFAAGASMSTIVVVVNTNQLFIIPFQSVK
jgi:hypothetical protein